MGYSQLLNDPDARQKINSEILAKHGKWDAWWAAVNAEFGTALIDAMVAAGPEKMAERLDGRLVESPMEALFWSSAHGLIEGLEPQYTVTPYRLDFAVPRIMLAIEIDGHEYHSSIEQRNRDSKRSRFLQSAGWQVVRFTGSEIYADAQRCVDELLNIIGVREAG